MCPSGCIVVLYPNLGADSTFEWPQTAWTGLVTLHRSFEVTKVSQLGSPVAPSFSQRLMRVKWVENGSNSAIQGGRLQLGLKQQKQHAGLDWDLAIRWQSSSKELPRTPRGLVWVVIRFRSFDQSDRKVPGVLVLGSHKEHQISNLDFQGSRSKGCDTQAPMAHMTVMWVASKRKSCVIQPIQLTRDMP